LLVAGPGEDASGMNDYDVAIIGGGPKAHPPPSPSTTTSSRKTSRFAISDVRLALPV
jgi:hypothetical protein